MSASLLEEVLEEVLEIKNHVIGIVVTSMPVCVSGLQAWLHAGVARMHRAQTLNAPANAATAYAR